MDVNNQYVSSNETKALIGASVLVNFPPPQGTVSFRRTQLIGTRLTDDKKFFQVLIELNVKQEMDVFEGIYSTTYNPDLGALVNLEYLLETTPGTYTTYRVDTTQSAQTNFCSIDKQSPSERILRGSFQGTLRNVSDSTDYLYLTNGSFADINY